MFKTYQLSEFAVPWPFIASFFFLLYLSYHYLLWLSRTFYFIFMCSWFVVYYIITIFCDCQVLFFKKYDKIIIQIFVRVCSAQTIQFWFYQTFVWFVCIINPTEKYRNTAEKHMFGGSKNKKQVFLFFVLGIAASSIHQLKK